MDGQGGASFSPVSLIALLVLGYLIWSLPRRTAVCPLLVMTGLMPMGQQLNVAGVHFYLFRILLLVGMARVAVRGEFMRLKWTRIDKVFAWYVVVSVVLGTLVKPTTEMMVSRLGEAFNSVGCYFFVRSVVLDLDDILAGVRTLVYLSIPVAAFMLFERTTGHNLLSIFGGVADLSDVRNGHVRAQGAFRHPILAGTFGATEFALFVALWFYRRADRRLAVIGVIASLIIVVSANSSGALMATAGSIVGLALWRIRDKMKLLRRLTVVTLLVLELAMKSHVWFLIAKVSDLVGGGGWHRAFVIDTAVKHFNEWWLIGTAYTAHWGPAGEVIAANPDMMDITDQFVVEGVAGGLLRLALFVTIITLCFKTVGRRLRISDDGEAAGFFVWSLGVALAAHCLSFLSITYFDQIIIVWFWLLAVISGLINIPVVADKNSTSVEDGSAEWREEPAVHVESVAACC